jgi:hypothetical protein
MTNIARAAGLAILGALIHGPAAQAQFPGQARPSASSPAYSPYLNILRPGGAANNYYGLVRPQIDTQNQVNTLQQQVGTLNQNANGAPIDQPLGLPTTGHASSFMNYSHFYPGMVGGNRGGGRPGTTAARPGAAAPSVQR